MITVSIPWHCVKCSGRGEVLLMSNATLDEALVRTSIEHAHLAPGCTVAPDRRRRIQIHFSQEVPHGA